MSKHLSSVDKLKLVKKTGKDTIQYDGAEYVKQKPLLQRLAPAAVAASGIAIMKTDNPISRGIKNIPDLIQENTYNHYVAYLNKQITEEELIEKINSGEISKEYLEMLQEGHFDKVKKAFNYVRNNPGKTGLGIMGASALGGSGVAGVGTLAGGVLIGGKLIKKANEKYDLTGKAKRAVANSAIAQKSIEKLKQSKNKLSVNLRQLRRKKFGLNDREKEILQKRSDSIEEHKARKEKIEKTNKLKNEIRNRIAILKIKKNQDKTKSLANNEETKNRLRNSLEEIKNKEQQDKTKISKNNEETKNRLRNSLEISKNNEETKNRLRNSLEEIKNKEQQEKEKERANKHIPIHNLNISDDQKTSLLPHVLKKFNHEQSIATSAFKQATEEYHKNADTLSKLGQDKHKFINNRAKTIATSMANTKKHANILKEFNKNAKREFLHQGVSSEAKTNIRQYNANFNHNQSVNNIHDHIDHLSSQK